MAGIQILNQFQKIANFKRNYLDNDNDSEFTVKTKNAPFFMNFPNIYIKIMANFANLKNFQIFVDPFRGPFSIFC